MNKAFYFPRFPVQCPFMIETKPIHTKSHYLFAFTHQSRNLLISEVRHPIIYTLTFKMFQLSRLAHYISETMNTLNTR